jgi:uncharacterized protein (TIGR03067 family)
MRLRAFNVQGSKKVISEKPLQRIPVKIGAMKLIALACAAGSLGFLCGCSKISHHMNITDNLSGTWSCLSATVDGKPLAKETTDLLRLTLSQNRYTTEKGSQVLFESTYTVDPAKKPKQINMVGTEGDRAGKEAQGIYSVEGDVLRICYVMPGLPRPQGFESPTGSKAFLVIWRRNP